MLTVSLHVRSMDSGWGRLVWISFDFFQKTFSPKFELLNSGCSLSVSIINFSEQSREEKKTNQLKPWTVPLTVNLGIKPRLHQEMESTCCRFTALLLKTMHPTVCSKGYNKVSIKLEIRKRCRSTTILFHVLNLGTAEDVQWLRLVLLFTNWRLDKLPTKTMQWEIQSWWTTLDEGKD